MTGSAVRVALGLGSNIAGRDLTPPPRRLVRTIAAIGDFARRLDASSFFVTKPEGVTDQPDFINAVVTGFWPGSAGELHHRLKALEAGAGRPEPARRRRDAPRTLDIDILLFGQRCCVTPELTIPHPRMLERGFVLVPLAEIAPSWILPQCGCPVQPLAARFGLPRRLLGAAVAGSGRS